jgi:hypothetical protein
MLELPAPWGEIEIPSVFTITVPTQNLRMIDNVETLANFYKTIFKHFVELMGTSRIHNHERMTFDSQIVAGECFESGADCKNILLKIATFWPLPCILQRHFGVINKRQV